MDRVRVHYDSPRPAGLRALAYTAGENIYLGPNQERHLPHEAWHTVQQRQGRVRPTARMAGEAVNDDPLLEREAMDMGARAARGTPAPLPPALAPLAAGGLSPQPVIQRMPANSAYNQALAELGDQDIDGNYLDVVGQNTEANAAPAYIVNTILSYREVGQIPAVIDAIRGGLRKSRFQGRVAVVLGINAPSDRQADLDTAITQAAEAIEGYGFPVAIVRSTFQAGRPFPYGRMRNQVLHSQETRDLTRLFARSGYHPYVSIQDFDTSSRRMESAETPHIFDAVDRALFRGPRPLMIAGGYRPGGDLAARTIARFQAQGEEVPKALTEHSGEPFAKEFSEHIYSDMASRQAYAKVHPLLPYSPEPNLYLDAMAVAYGHQLGLDPLSFGEGAAEFTQLAKGLSQYEMAELTHHYAERYMSAPASVEVAMPPPLHTLSQQLEQNEQPEVSGQEAPDFEVEEAQEFAAWLDSGQSAAFVEEEPGVESLEQDQEEIAAWLEVDAQTGRHPRRGLTYHVDYTGLAVETDLSRLAYSYLSTGKDPQSHIGRTTVADRFFEDKPSKSKTSMSDFAEFFGGKDAEEQEAIRRGLLDPKSKFSKKPFMPFRKANVMSSALSKPFGGPFRGISTGIQPSQKLVAFGAAAMALPQAVLRLSFLLERSLSRIANGTPMDGNCLYHAVIQAQNGGQVDDDAAADLRQQAVQWALDDANLPTVSQYAFDHGVPIDHLIDTLSRNGNWSGQQGDLTPQIVASAINRNIRILTTTGQIYVIPPLAGPAAATVTIQLDLANQHYSVPQAPPQSASSSSSMNVE